MTRWLVPLLALGLSAAAPAVTIVDGDTFVLAGQTIRLWGVDAPEGRQVCVDDRNRSYRCGDVAREQLRGLIARGPVSCEKRDRDGYGRTVARCRAGDVDLGAALVRAGWAVEQPHFSGGAYERAEAQAKAARRGIWAGRFELPEAWRAARRAEAKPPAPPPGLCVLKGNINAKGRRIFHAPGQRDYAATAIDTAKGERWFCTAAEAEAAGWVAAQR